MCVYVCMCHVCITCCIPRDLLLRTPGFRGFFWGGERREELRVGPKYGGSGGRKGNRARERERCSMEVKGFWWCDCRIWDVSVSWFGDRENVRGGGGGGGGPETLVKIGILIHKS